MRSLSFYPLKIKHILALLLTFITLVPAVAVSGINSAAAFAADGPDLIVSSITLSPAEPAIDETVSITAAVKNQGNSAAGPSHVVCYVDSTILATVQISSLGAGTSTTATFTWKAEQGSHTIKAIADTTNIVNETSETNNTNTYAITTKAADLIVQSITWSPPNPSRGEAVMFSVVLKNQGNAVSRTTNMELFIDGSSRGLQDIPAINPGGTATKTYNWVAIVGQHAIKAAADQLNHVKESNESNNERTVTFSTEAPDLTIDKIIWSPLNISKNDTVSLTATVKNQGSGTADACHLAYYIDNELISTLPVSSLGAGVSVNITFNWKALSDKHELKTVVDYYKYVTESDENNNENLSTLITLAPDLTVTGITWTPADAAVGDEVTFTARIKNLGGGRSEQTKALCYVGNNYLVSLNIPEIAAGEYTLLVFKWVATGGSHPVSVNIDSDNLLLETSKDNNKLIVTINIIPPDLYTPSITWSPVAFAIDDMVTFSVNITNQGGGKAENFYVAFYMDDELLTSTPVTSIDSGNWVVRTCTWKALNGRHTFKAIADLNNYVTEDNENNNESQVIIAPNMPDVTVETVTWTPANIQAGVEITYDIIIKNLGTLNAGPTRIAYYVDGDVAGYSDIGQLDAGKSATVQFIWSAKSGVHTIDIVSDSSNTVFELDETNNTKTVSVPPPDLFVQDITWSPVGASVGDSLEITAKIANQGNSRSQTARLSLYIDGLLTGVNDISAIDTGSSISSAFKWTAVQGTHKIKITADSTNRVTESDETNNSKEVGISTLTPDLVITDIGWLMVNPLADDKVDIAITVKNQGTGSAAAGRLKYTVDNTPTVWENINVLQPDGTAAISFSLYLKAGSHTITATIDPSDKISELDESNNNIIVTFNTIMPDITIKSITITPAAPIPADNVTAAVKIENRGRGAIQNVKISFSVDGSVVDIAEIKTIAMGAIVSQNFNWKAQAGQHEFSVYADADKLIVESDETNNTKSRTITVEKPAVSIPKTPNISANPKNENGFLEDNWWMLLLGAAVLGGGAFFMMLKSMKKG